MNNIDFGAKQRCSVCKTAYYCESSCQRQDYWDHKLVCGHASVEDSLTSRVHALCNEILSLVDQGRVELSQAYNEPVLVADGSPPVPIRTAMAQFWRQLGGLDEQRNFFNGTVVPMALLQAKASKHCRQFIVGRLRRFPSIMEQAVPQLFDLLSVIPSLPDGGGDPSCCCWLTDLMDSLTAGSTSPLSLHHAGTVRSFLQNTPPIHATRKFKSHHTGVDVPLDLVVELELTMLQAARKYLQVHCLGYSILLCFSARNKTLN